MRPALPKLSAVEYKTLKQYQRMGDMLDAFKQFGLRAGVEDMARKDRDLALENGHGWLTE